MYRDMSSDEYTDLAKLTLDTHVFIWYTEGINLTPSQVELIEKA
jgi:PIN domain nuclease of toxin-antitoxin system